MRATLRNAWREEKGEDLLEYALLLLMVALAAIASIGPLGASIGGLFGTAKSCAASPNSASCKGVAIGKGKGP